MPTTAHAAMLEDTLGNPYLGPFPVAEAYAKEGFRPSATYSHKVGDRIRFGLELASTENGEGGDESDGASGLALGASLAVAAAAALL